VLVETPRLLLRRFCAEDLEDFAALHADPRVTRFVRPLDRAEARQRLAKDEAEWRERGHGLLAVLEKGTGDFLGRSGLKHWPQFDETEVGWVLRRNAWGHGYATEAGRACVEWGLSELDLPYLTAMIGPANTRSVAVAERLGFRPLREDRLLGVPVVVHALHRSDRPPGLRTSAS
jgi:RimJ/RimL family protein N-acetyltransferase